MISISQALSVMCAESHTVTPTVSLSSPFSPLLTVRNLDAFVSARLDYCNALLSGLLKNSITNFRTQLTETWQALEWRITSHHRLKNPFIGYLYLFWIFCVILSLQFNCCLVYSTLYWLCSTTVLCKSQRPLFMYSIPSENAFKYKSFIFQERFLRR